jgi:hypothetical protein
MTSDAIVKGKRTKRQTMVTKTLSRKQITPLIPGDDRGCSKRVHSSCTSSDILHGTVTAHELTLAFLWSSCCSIVSFLYSIFCGSLVVFCPCFVIALSVDLRLLMTPFWCLKTFLKRHKHHLLLICCVVHVFTFFVKCVSFYYQYMLEKTRGVMQNEQSSETLATQDTGQRKTK